MGYKNKTNFYRIPYMGSGDKMTEEQNKKQWSIVDNLLYTATFGCQSCFLQQGKYYLEKSSSGNVCNLIIQPINEKGFAIMGMLNYRLFYCKQKLVIGAMFSDLKYYVYIEYTQQMEIDPNAYQINFYTYQKEENKYRMLLCIVQTTENPFIDIDVNKIYSKNILAHTMDNTNPHGKTLHQDCVQISKELLINDDKIYPCFYDSFITKKDYLYQIYNKQVKFVHVYPQEVSAGIISWKITNEGILFNHTGQDGIRVNIKVEYI